MINDTATGSVSFMNVERVILGLLHVGMFYFVTVMNLLLFLFSSQAVSVCTVPRSHWSLCVTVWMN